MWIQDSLVVPGAAFQSDNATSGITFIAFQRKSNGTPYDSISLNVGPNPGASGSTTANQDYGDSIYIDSGNRYTSAVRNSTLIAGNETSYQDSVAYGANAVDNDIIFFGNEKSQDGSTYAISLTSTSGTFATTIKYADGASSQSLAIENNFVYTGKDNDTLVFANAVAGSRIANNYFSTGTGADFVYFAQPSTIFGGNIINIGNENKTPDSSADTICFNRNAAGSVGSDLTNLNGTTTFLTIQGFQDGQDRLYYKGVFYSTQQSITSQSWNGGRIRFDNGTP